MSKLNIGWLSKLLNKEVKTTTTPKDYLIVGSFEAKGRTKESRARESENIISVDDFTSTLDPSLLPTPTPGYTEYRATLVQAGAGAPVPTELNNTLGAGTWSKVADGIYHFTLAGAFANAPNVEVDIENVLVTALTMSNNAFNIYSAAVLDANTLEVKSATWEYTVVSGGPDSALTLGGILSVDYSLTDSLLNNTRFLISVW